VTSDDGKYFLPEKVRGHFYNGPDWEKHPDFMS